LEPWSWNAGRRNGLHPSPLDPAAPPEEDAATNELRPSPPIHPFTRSTLLQLAPLDDAEEVEAAAPSEDEAAKKKLRLSPPAAAAADAHPPASTHIRFDSNGEQAPTPAPAPAPAAAAGPEGAAAGANGARSTGVQQQQGQGGEAQHQVAGAAAAAGVAAPAVAPAAGAGAGEAAAAAAGPARMSGGGMEDEEGEGGITFAQLQNMPPTERMDADEVRALPPANRWKVYEVQVGAWW